MWTDFCQCRCVHNKTLMPNFWNCIKLTSEIGAEVRFKRFLTLKNRCDASSIVIHNHVVTILFLSSTVFWQCRHQSSKLVIAIAILIFMPAEQTINPIKKITKGVPKTCNTNGQVSTNNTTKQPDDIGQLVTSYSCDVSRTAPPSQTHTIEIMLFR